MGGGRQAEKSEDWPNSGSLLSAETITCRWTKHGCERKKHMKDASSQVCVLSNWANGVVIHHTGEE